MAVKIVALLPESELFAMKLYKCLDQYKADEKAMEVVTSDDDVERLKQHGLKLCRENGVHDALWLVSTKSWQVLSSTIEGQPSFHFVIRP